MRPRTEASSALSVKTAKRCLAADNKPAALPVKLPAVLAMPMRSLRPVWVKCWELNAIGLALQSSEHRHPSHDPPRTTAPTPMITTSSP
jgi:hypothetical protein